VFHLLSFDHCKISNSNFNKYFLSPFAYLGKNIFVPLPTKTAKFKVKKKLKGKGEAKAEHLL